MLVEQSGSVGEAGEYTNASDLLGRLDGTPSIAASAFVEGSAPRKVEHLAREEHIAELLAMDADISPALTQKLQQALARFDALEALLICTSEGVPLVRVVADEASDVSHEYAETVLPTIFASAAEQVGKLKFGAVESVTAFFEDVVLIHVNAAPLVLTLIAADSPQIGALHALARQLRPVLAPLNKVVESADVH